MLHSIVFLLLSATQYGPVQAHQDSLFIYNAYTQSDTLFERAAEPQQWKEVSDSIEHVTADAFNRLHKYNKEKYAPVDELNREAIGVAFVFAQPSIFTAPDGAKPGTDLKTDANNTAANDAAGKQIAFKVLDEQTHFLIGPNGKGRTPYVVMNYYAKGRVLVKSEKLNPVTLQPIQTEQSGLTASSN